MFNIGQAVKIKGLPQDVRYTIAEIRSDRYILQVPSGVILLGQGYTNDELEFYEETDKVRSILTHYPQE